MIEEPNYLAMEAAFYEKPFYFSYSSLSKLLYSPRLFYSQYILQKKEEKTDPHLIEGKVIHCLLLEEEKFDEKFVVSPLLLPSDNTKSIIDKVFKQAESIGKADEKLDIHSEFILEVLKEVNLHQSLKTDQQRLDKIINTSTISYYEFLQKKKQKDVIDIDTYNNCKDIVYELKQNPDISDALMLSYIEPGIEVSSEIYLETQLKDHPFGIKGVIDRLIIDSNQKVITIVDFKTTGKSIVEFKDSVEYYKYWLQAAMYIKLIKEIYIENNFADYTINFKFVTVDKYKQSYVFVVTKDTESQWIERTNKELTYAKWHYENRMYNLPFDFQMHLVQL